MENILTFGSNSPRRKQERMLKWILLLIVICVQGLSTLEVLDPQQEDNVDYEDLWVIFLNASVSINSLQIQQDKSVWYTTSPDQENEQINTKKRRSLCIWIGEEKSRSIRLWSREEIRLRTGYREEGLYINGFFGRFN